MRLAVIAALVACKSPREEPPPAKQPAFDLAQTGSDDKVVQPGNAGAGRLAFTITAVHASSKPSTVAPFYAAGGDWTYVEAHVAGDPAAVFVVGMPTGSESFANAYLVPTTASAGSRVVAHLARALDVAVPAVVRGGSLAPFRFEAAMLGQQMGRGADGYSGRGTWDATKWFCPLEELDAPAELFFNIDVAGRRGEWSEKDSSYNKDMLACFAIALRDGVPPPRTPASDPTLAATGPRFELGKRIGSRRMELVKQTARRLIFNEDLADHAVLVEVDPATGVRRELASTPGLYEFGHCDETATVCAIAMAPPPKDRNSHTFQGPATIVFLDGAKVAPLDVPAFGKRPTVESVSPDGRIVVIEAHEGNASKFVAWNRTTKRALELPPSGKDTPRIGDWVKDGPRWIAVIVDNMYDDGPHPSRDWRLEEGGSTTPSKQPWVDAHPPVSPDGSRRADFTADGKLTIRPLPNGSPRTLTLHPQDARYTSPGCCPWLDNRYLVLRTRRFGFIDTDTMKVSFAPDLRDAADSARPPDDRIDTVTGSRIAVVTRDDGVFLASILAP